MSFQDQLREHEQKMNKIAAAKAQAKKEAAEKAAEWHEKVAERSKNAEECIKKVSQYARDKYGAKVAISYKKDVQSGEDKLNDLFISFGTGDEAADFRLEIYVDPSENFVSANGTSPKFGGYVKKTFAAFPDQEIDFDSACGWVDQYIAWCFQTYEEMAAADAS